MPVQHVSRRRRADGPRAPDEAALRRAALRRAALRRAVRGALGARATAPRYVVAAVAALWTAAAAGSPYLPEEALAALLPGSGGDGSEGFVIEGAMRWDALGGAVSGAGDVNGDGIADVVVAAPHANRGGRVDLGEAYVIFGRDAAQAGSFAAVFRTAQLLPEKGGDGSEGFVLRGISADDSMGRSVSAAGDVNGDGIGDLVIGAPYADAGSREDSGESYVVFGRDETQGETFPAVFELASLLPVNGGDGSQGFVLNGIAERDTAGFAVSGAGDVNGDGIDDIIIGARSADFGGRVNLGNSYVVFGRAADPAPAFPPVFELVSLTPQAGGDGSDGFVIAGADAHGYSGYDVDAAGDVNGDGIDDVIAGAWNATPDTAEYTGAAYVVFGRAPGQFGATLDLITLLPEGGGDGSLGFVLLGAEDDSILGEAVAGVGDVNGDGIADIGAGAHGAEPYDEYRAGQAYVVFGRSVLQGNAFPPVFPVASLLPENGGDGTTGFALSGSNRSDSVGHDLARAGDWNGDGIDDLVVSGTGISSDSRLSTGVAFVYFGRSSLQGDAFPPALDLNLLLPGNGGDGSVGFAVSGIAAQDYTGESVGGAGDVNGDGLIDLVIGARSTEGLRDEGEGEAYVFFGRSPDAMALDSDADGSKDDVDMCAETVIPEPLPGGLQYGRFALANDDRAFDRGYEQGRMSPRDITTVTTRGCSCEQIASALGHGPAEGRFGCKGSTLDIWLRSLAPGHGA